LKQTLRRLAPYFAPHQLGLCGILALALSSSALGAIEPLLMKALFDALAAGRPVTALATFVGALLGMLLLREALAALLDALTWRVRIGAGYAMLQATVTQLHALPLAYHKKQGVGALMTKLDRGIQGCVNAFSEIAFHLLPALVYLALSAVVMVRLDWRLSLVVLLFAPAPALIGMRAATEQTDRERRLMSQWVDIYARFNEVLSGIQVVKSFAMEESEKKRFLTDVDEANSIVVRGVRTDAGTNAAKNALTTIARVAAIATGAYLVMRHEISIGTLVAFIAYAAGLFAPVQALTGMYQTLRRGSVAVETLSDILDAEDALSDAPDAIPVGTLRGEVELQNVTFGYRDASPIVRDVSLRVAAGEHVALVGPSGAGKTTLMVLLQRLYDPTAGAVLIDGVDVRRYQQRSLRRHIGVVLQEGLLFSDTIRENIAFGRPEATMDEIIAAATAANAHEFIAALPDGYNTRVGERGSSLSGGERQRIAIARAILKDPEILILDEATSALDAENEAKVQDALERLMRGRTTFIIAHRLSTVVNADRILVLRNGAIDEQGTHDDLVADNGYYASLVRFQMRGLTRAA
jgi:ATP-binding cassette, subfamily B, bacterial